MPCWTCRRRSTASTTLFCCTAPSDWSWFNGRRPCVVSFLSERTQQIAYNGELLDIQLVLCVWHPSTQCLRAPAVHTVYHRAVSRRRWVSVSTCTSMTAKCTTSVRQPMMLSPQPPRLSACMADINDCVRAQSSATEPSQDSRHVVATSQQLDKITSERLSSIQRETSASLSTVSGRWTHMLSLSVTAATTTAAAATSSSNAITVN